MMICEPDYRAVSDIEDMFKIAEAKANTATEVDTLLKDLSREARDARSKYLFERYTARVSALSAFLRSGIGIYACKVGMGTFRVNKAILSLEPPGPDIGFSGFWLLRSKSWMIDVSKANIWIEAAEKMHASFLVNVKVAHAAGRDVSPIRDKNLRIRELRERVELLSRSFAQIDGAFLCIREADTPAGPEKIYQWYALGADDEVEYSALGGRQRKQEGVLEAYYRVFPTGHTGHSWKTVAKRVAESAGLKFHVDTLKRALGKKGE
jgi:hypothetical protein